MILHWPDLRADPSLVSDHQCEWPLGCPTMTPRRICRFHAKDPRRKAVHERQYQRQYRTTHADELRAYERQHRADKRRQQAIDKARELLRTVTPIGAG